MEFFSNIAKIFETSSFNHHDMTWQTIVMYVIVAVLFYLAIVKKFEPLLLIPIAFGMLLANIPGANIFHMNFFVQEPALLLTAKRYFTKAVFSTFSISALSSVFIRRLSSSESVQ